MEQSAMNMKHSLLSSLVLAAMVSMPEGRSGGGGNITFNGSTDDPNGDSGTEFVSKATQAVLEAQGQPIDAKQPGLKFLSDPAMLKAAQEGAIGFTGKTAQVSKQGAEGLLTIDSFTGVVVLNEDTPEWATDLGLVSAVLSERHAFYASRLGPQYAMEHVSPEVFAYEDLAWLTLVDDGANGTEAIVEADEEHRMEVVAAVIGIDRDTGYMKGEEYGTEFMSDNTRTEAELQALQEAARKPEAVEAHG
jgi:hypothetical protein